MNQVIREDLVKIREEFARPRKTAIEDSKEAVYEEAPAVVSEVVFAMDKFGYCKLFDKAAYERNQEAVDGEYPHLIRCMNTDKLCIFTNAGYLHQVRMGDVPFGKLRDKGVPVDNISKFDGSKEEIIFLSNLEALLGQQLLFATRMALVKRVPAEEFITNNRTVMATKLQDNDTLIAVRPTGDETELVLQTDHDVFLRFALDEIPEMKKNSRGVRGIKLTKDEMLEQVYFTSQEPVIKYKKKEVHLNRLKIGKRDGKGNKVRL